MIKHLIIFISLFIGFGYHNGYGANPSIGNSSLRGSFNVGINGFIENKGQIRDQFDHFNNKVLFQYHGKCMNIQLRADGFSYDLFRVVTSASQTAVVNSLSIHGEANIIDSIYFNRIDVTFLHARNNLIPVAMNPLPGYTNYYNPITPDSGINFVHSFEKIVYPEIYPFIDIEFMYDPYSDMGSKPKPDFCTDGFKYNFIIHPGGNPNDIKMYVEGSDASNLTAQGHLLYQSGNSYIEETIPQCYQLVSEMKEPVSASFVEPDVKSTSNHIFGLSTGTYNHSLDVIIDPVPWVSYFGGSNSDWAFSVCLDTGGNVVITGKTLSTSSIATSGAFQGVYGGGSEDAFIAKFNPSGTTCLWATYYGGSGLDGASSVNADTSGNILVLGTTTSTNAIASTLAYQAALAGSYDVFIVKFSYFGTRIWGTYYGADQLDACGGAVLDRAGNIYLTGWTSSSGLATLGAYQTSYAGGNDAFVAKFNASGSGFLSWCTYYGGNSTDAGYSIALDANGDLVVTGNTNSTASIASSGACQDTIGGGTDAFVLKLSSSGNIRIWATYLGGSVTEYAWGIKTDQSLNVYVAGYSNSTTNFSTIGASQSTYGGGYSDAFLAKYDPNGFKQWVTYIGGSASDYARSLAVDSVGNIYLTGNTGSSSGIATAGAPQATYGGGPPPEGDVMIEKFAPSGARIWGTYFGSTGIEIGWGITLDKYRNIIICGETCSDTGFATSGAYQTTWGGGGSYIRDAFVAYTNSGGGLPVTLKSFNGEIIDQHQVLLTWSTSMELNNDHYQIERSTNGLYFDGIGSVRGNGNSNVERNYSYTDKSLPQSSGIIYYRLKQFDFDGRYSYSEIVTVEFSDSRLEKILIAPNPANNEISLSQQAEHVEIFDLKGSLILSKDNTSRIDISELCPGMYFIITDNKAAKFIISR